MYIIIKYIKVVYVVRNPKDVLVSHYPYLKSLVGGFEADFKQLFDNFLEGKCNYFFNFDHVVEIIYKSSSPSSLRSLVRSH